MQYPLKGVKVIDLTYYAAGPGAARILADWGADVIKIEPPAEEPGRTTGTTIGIPANEESDGLKVIGPALILLHIGHALERCWT